MTMGSSYFKQACYCEWGLNQALFNMKERRFNHITNRKEMNTQSREWAFPQIAISVWVEEAMLKADGQVKRLGSQLHKQLSSEILFPSTWARQNNCRWTPPAMLAKENERNLNQD